MIDPGPGILLIADPFLKDPNFLRSVVILCEHQDEGSFGFVLNRLYDNTLDELLPGIEGYRLPVYYGGPVHADTVHFLHQYPEEIPGGVEIMKGIFWGGEFEKAIGMIKNKRLDPNKIRFFVGYSGWGEGQLAGEIEEKTWLTGKASRSLIFHNIPADIWKESIKSLGGDYQQLVHFPIDPQLN